MISDQPVRNDMFKGMNGDKFFSPQRNGQEKTNIFGNAIPQAYSKPDQKTSACCYSPGQPMSGGRYMNGFYSTIWKRNLQNILITNMAFGDTVCCNV